MGSSWARITRTLNTGRSANDVKNHWHSHLSKRFNPEQASKLAENLPAEAMLLLPPLAAPASPPRAASPSSSMFSALTSNSRKRHKRSFFRVCGGLGSPRLSFQMPPPTRPAPPPCEPVNSELDLLCHEDLDGGVSEDGGNQENEGKQLAPLTNDASEATTTVSRPAKMQRLSIEAPSYDALSRMGQLLLACQEPICDEQTPTSSRAAALLLACQEHECHEHMPSPSSPPATPQMQTQDTVSPSTPRTPTLAKEADPSALMERAIAMELLKVAGVT